MRADERENERYANGADNPVEKEEEIMFSLLPEARGKSLLDIGCGVGTIGLMLKERGFEYVGIDLSEVGVKRAVQKGLNAFVSDIDGDGLKFPDASFDVVWAGDVLEHVFDPIGMLAHVRRVLKPGGSLLLTAPNDFSLASRLNIFLTGRSVQSSTYRTLRQCKHHTSFSWELLEYMLVENGLKVTEFRSIVRLPKTSTDRISGNRTWGRLFGKVFIVKVGHGAAVPARRQEPVGAAAPGSLDPVPGRA